LSLKLNHIPLFYHYSGTFPIISQTKTASWPLNKGEKKLLEAQLLAKKKAKKNCAVFYKLSVI
jgi:hypothetical protein